MQGSGDVDEMCDVCSMVREGDYVVVDENGEKKSIQLARATGRLKVGKSFVPARQIIGAPYGAVFELVSDRKTLKRIERPLTDGFQLRNVIEVEKDNRDLQDLNHQNQKLTKEEIDALRQQGKGGADIISALCENSATFGEKTEFAQEKYKKRKAKKYLTLITLRRPSIRTLCDAYYEKQPLKIHNLRSDSLAIMISMANVGAGAQVLVIEDCQGLLTAAAVSRLGGHGRVCVASLDSRMPQINSVDLMNISAEGREVLRCVKLEELLNVGTRAASPKRHSTAPRGAHPTGPADDAIKEELKFVVKSEAAEEEALVGAPADWPAVKSEVLNQGGDDIPDRAHQLNGTTGPEATPGSYEQNPTVPGSPFRTSRAEIGQPLRAEMNAEKMEADRDLLAGGACSSSMHYGVQEKTVQGPGALSLRDICTKVCGVSGGPAGEVVVKSEESERCAKKRRAEALLDDEGGPSRKRRSLSASPQELQDMMARGFTSCLVANPRTSPSDVMPLVLPLLASSAPFAIYSPWLQPLAECHHLLSSTHQAVMLQLQESWMRPYQVLPGRTHPFMACSGTGGYILSGIKVTRDL